MEKRQILICDDEEGVRESLRVILGGDYELEFVSNGEEAIEYVRLRNPEVAILDIKMPKMNGLEALGRIKQLKSHVCVVMITGYESSDVAAQASRLGACGYLTKPFDRESILAQIKEILEHRGA